MFVSQYRYKPLIMGILNLTPDSFSDGGKFVRKEQALSWAAQMIEEGADLIDIGGESTRPGAQSIPVTEELDRTIHIVETLHQQFPSTTLSIDTTKYEVAREALKAGATVINDVSGGSDIRILGLLEEYTEAKVILMHRKGDPKSMQVDPHYSQGAVTEVKAYLESRVRVFNESGVGKNRLWVDPGIGFGKNLNHNLDLLRHLKQFVTIGERLVIGTSRKSFLEKLLGSEPLAMEDRNPGTLASNLWAYQSGASVFRVHEVGDFKRALQTWEAILNGCL